ncbi:CAP domain-containing protein [uncultured Psychrobacter sp.]|uniref:CAP domain-containing protein n=1 Tax=uncultured Psychrobacter sp. TaxID=259303 RepID=UPI0034598771
MMTFNAAEKSIAIALFSTLFLTACGGGGSDDSSNNASPPTTIKPSAADEPTEPVNTPELTKPTDTVKPPTQSSNATDSTKPPKPTDSSDVNKPTDNPANSVAILPTGAAEMTITDVKSKSYDVSAKVGSSLLSLQRQSCGLSAVTENKELTKIATQHAQYIQHVFSNSRPTTFNAHYENKITDIKDWTGSNNPFFTGVSFKDRLVKANYSNLAYGVAENISQITYFSSAGRVTSPDYAAQGMTKSLLAAPYHMRLLMTPNLSQTGSGMVAYTPHNKDADKSQGYVLVNASSADKKTVDKTVKGLFTYPCADVTNTNTALYNEFPSPVAGTGRDLGIDPIGQPIYISMPTAKSIKVSNVRFRDVQRNINVPIDLLDYSNDPYKGTEYELPNNEAFILPLTDSLKSCEIGRKKGQNCGLYGNSDYRVSFDVLVDNKTLETKAFTFSTGEVNY